jgi:hypothetical protein
MAIHAEQMKPNYAKHASSLSISKASLGVHPTQLQFSLVPYICHFLSIGGSPNFIHLAKEN